MIKIYTDGSSTKSRSGWGIVMVAPSNHRINSDWGIDINNATNQQMELTAVLRACEWYVNSGYYETEDCTVYSDSAYIINCVSDGWYITWENNNWITSKNTPVANKELWQQLIPYFRDPKINFIKVKGHAGHEYNEMADALARGIDLTQQKNNDIIYKEVSNVMIKYTMKKLSIKEAVDLLVKMIKRG